jgi:FMN phosphatase YigB (HAD superfamily)
VSYAPRAVFFDVGDTLVCRPTIGPGRRIAQALGLSDEQARAITRLVFTEPFASPAALAERLVRALGLEAGIEAPIAAIWRAQEVEPVEVPGATECVAGVHGTGAWIGVVSNIWEPYEAGFRRACPAIVPLVSSWHVSYRVGAAKPAPAIFQAALEAAGVPAARAVMVGDSLEKDIRPALALGMTALWVLPEEGTTAEGVAGATPPAELGTATAPALSPPDSCVVARGLREAHAMLLAVLAGKPISGVADRARLGNPPGSL